MKEKNGENLIAFGERGEEDSLKGKAVEYGKELQAGFY